MNRNLFHLRTYRDSTGRRPGAAANPEAPLDHAAARKLLSRSRWALAGFLLIALAAQWGVIGSWIHEDERQAELATDRVMSQLTASIKEETLRLIKLVETYLLSVDHWLAANPRVDPRTDRNLAALVDDLRRASDGLIDIRMVSRDGKLFYIPTPDGKPLADVTDRDYFRAQLDPATRGFFVAAPVVSRVTGKAGLPFSIPLRREVGGIAVLFAAVELDRLQPSLEAQRMKPSGTIALIRTDGVMMNRVPYDKKFIGRSIADSATFRGQFGARESGFFRSSGEIIEGVPRYVSFARVGDYPLLVSVTAGVDDVLRDVRQRRAIMLTFGAVLSLALIALAGSLYVNFRKAEAAELEMGRRASTDGLTGFLNRESFFGQAEAELTRAQRYDRPMAVVVLDLDHFKLINDSRGHGAGDAVLKAAAQIWHQKLRDGDIIGRIGGEEFCVILPHTELEGALEFAERLRSSLERLRLPPPHDDIVVTVSAGVTAATRADLHVKDAIARADAALYTAKREGRNCIRSA